LIWGTSVRRTTDWPTGPFNATVPFDSVEYDDDGLWSPSSPTILGPIPKGTPGRRGVFWASAIWTGDTTYAELKIFRNGDANNPIAVQQQGSNPSNSGVTLVSRPIPLQAGDRFELCARSGDPALVLGVMDYSVRFAVEIRG
jgi:hypothetical protein